MYVLFQEVVEIGGQMLSQRAEAVIREKETASLKRPKCHYWQYPIFQTGLNILPFQIEGYWQTKWNFWNRNFRKDPCPSRIIESLPKSNNNSLNAALICCVQKPIECQSISPKTDSPGHSRYGWSLLYSCILCCAWKRICNRGNSAIDFRSYGDNE